MTTQFETLATSSADAATVGAPAPDDVVLRMVLYYDIFRHPLRQAELERLTGGPVNEALDRLEAAGHIERIGNWVCRVGQTGHVPGRRARTEAAEALWSGAAASSRLLAGLPWIRGVLVTGGLSKQSGQPAGDVDFLLLVEPGWVWTTKSALQVLRRGMPEAVRRYFCANYLLATDHLEVDDKNAFTAMELATAIPVHGREACTQLLEANDWAERFVPGYAWSLERARRAPAMPKSRTAAAMERLGSPWQAELERRSMQLWNTYWNRKYDWLPEDTRKQRFKRRPEIATNHLHDFQFYVLDEFARRCDAAGVTPP